MDSGPIGVGYKYREFGGIPPFKGESEWRVTEFEPLSGQRHVGDDGMTTTDLLIELTPVARGTQVDMTDALTTKWFIAPLSMAMSKSSLVAKKSPRGDVR